MRLMEILTEVKAIEEAEILEEAKKKARKGIKNKIKQRYIKNLEVANKFAKKLRAKKNSINWTDDVKEVRNEVVSAFMAGDPDKVLDMMKAGNAKKSMAVIEVLRALEKAHGGYKKLEAKAGNRKTFVKTVFAYIDDLESEEA
jgi:hypothetical protein